VIIFQKLKSLEIKSSFDVMEYFQEKWIIRDYLCDFIICYIIQ